MLGWVKLDSVRLSYARLFTSRSLRDLNLSESVQKTSLSSTVGNLLVLLHGSISDFASHSYIHSVEVNFVYKF